MKCQHGVDVFGRCAPCEEGAYLILISELKAELAAARAEIERMTGELASANRECEVRNERELGYLARAQSAEAELEALRAERDALKAASMLAYGYLWSVQIEPGTPGLAPHKAVPAARIVLRDVLDNDKRKAGIEQVRAALGER